MTEKWRVDLCEGNPHFQGFHVWHIGQLIFNSFREAAEFAASTYVNKNDNVRIVPIEGGEPPQLS